MRADLSSRKYLSTRKIASCWFTRAYIILNNENKAVGGDRVSDVFPRAPVYWLSVSDCLFSRILYIRLLMQRSPAGSPTPPPLLPYIYRGFQETGQETNASRVRNCALALQKPITN